MKNIKLLKNLTFIFFIFQIIGIVLSLCVVMFTLFENGKALDIDGRTIDTENIIGKIITIVACMGYIAFTYGLFLFGYTIELFSKKIIFDDRIIDNFKKMGKTFLVAILLTFIPQFFPRIAVLKKTDNPEIMMGDFNSLLFKIALALFFIILSNVFRTAKELKEENELTV